jgi:DNA mismatch repair ATPase MutS
VLFLIDDILSGTNSSDRKIAARPVVETLIKAGAIGALSTRDLALTDIADSPQPGWMNVHMQSENPNAPLEFRFSREAWDSADEWSGYR